MRASSVTTRSIVTPAFSAAAAINSSILAATSGRARSFAALASAASSFLHLGKAARYAARALLPSATPCANNSCLAFLSIP